LKNEGADVATIHSFINTCAVNGLGRKRGIGNSSPNKGMQLSGPLDDLYVEDWEEMIRQQHQRCASGIAAALPVFRKHGFGHFVNTAPRAAITHLAG